MTNELAQVGQFCPNEACELYGEIEAAQVIRLPKIQKGAYMIKDKEETVCAQEEKSVWLERKCYR